MSGVCESVTYSHRSTTDGEVPDVIIHADGDLLASDVDALVNTVNCVGVMGKGIALQFKRRYPQMFKSYAAACRNGEVQIGRMFVVPTGALDGPGTSSTSPPRSIGDRPRRSSTSRPAWMTCGR